jgi:gliding motility-associated-like protein
MKYLFLIFFLLQAGLYAGAQNHVPNGSFELYDDCPKTWSDFEGYCRYWYNFTTATPDYHHPCGNSTPYSAVGYQEAEDGIAYAGIVMYNTIEWSEYIAVKIKQLDSGQLYDVGMSVSLAENGLWACNGLGVLFMEELDTVTTKAPIMTDPHVSFAKYGIITDDSNWTHISGSFVADKAYSYMVIGRFVQKLDTIVRRNSTLSVAYYFIDSVYLTPHNVPYPDVCIGDSFTVTDFLPAGAEFEEGNEFTFQMVDTTGKAITLVHYKKLPALLRARVDESVPPGKYRLRLQSTKPADVFYSERDFIVNALPTLKVSSDRVYCRGNIALSAETDNDVEVNWHGPQGFWSKGKNATVYEAIDESSGTYRCIAARGACIATDTLAIEVSCADIQVPGAFSPNGDGINDVLYMYGAGNISEVHLRLYNRWGNTVFETRDRHAGWDGRYKGAPQETETIAYLLQATKKDGTPVQKTGNITVIR